MTALAAAGALAPPAPGVLEEVKRRFFATPLQAAVSLISPAAIAFLGWKLLDWALLSAVFDASRGPEACQAASGACWSVITARWRIILFGLCPYEEQWRSALACVTVAVMTVLSCIPALWTGRRIAAVWIVGAAVFYVLMKGGVLGLGYWHRIGRILMPQAMRNALPATINQFVVSFKKTSLVVIVGFFGTLASGNAAYGTGDWRFAYVEV